MLGYRVTFLIELRIREMDHEAQSGARRRFDVKEFTHRSEVEVKKGARKLALWVDATFKVVSQGAKWQSPGARPFHLQPRR